MMSETTTYSAARANFASLCDRVTASREPVIIRRRNAADVVLIAADELAGLMETAHLLRSPRNAERLLAALARAEAGGGAPSSPAELRERLGLGQAAD
jgi:antitoxin YefM